MRYFLYCVILIVLASCDESRIFEKNEDLENKVWISDSSISFQFEVPDIRERYNLYFNVRNTSAYPYENIYIKYQLSDTLNNVLKNELVNYNLFDPKTGEPFGSGLGDVFDHQLLLLKDFKFERPGPFVFEMRQYMRMDSLPELLSAGMKVELVKPKE